MTTFPTTYQGMLVRDSIPFSSVCAHHIIPYIGVAHIGIIYDGRKLGLSKFIRAIQHWSAILSSQEELTQTIVEKFDSLLKPKGVIVVMTANHLCEAIRGIRVPNVATTTSWFSGAFEKHETRSEFYEELKLRGVR
jgi:GTP cyclohydrolase I